MDSSENLHIILIIHIGGQTNAQRQLAFREAAIRRENLLWLIACLFTKTMENT